MEILAEELNDWAEPHDSRTAALLEGALTAVRLGIPVLPLEGKAPAKWLVPNGVKDATDNEALIRQWWWDGTTHNVGGAVPRGVVVLDVDPRNGGDETLDRLFRDHGPLPPTRRCNSGGRDGGQHLWFHHPGVPLSARRLPGVDLKSYGGYLVLPPSIHPDSGRGYTWAEKGPLAKLPPALLAILSDSIEPPSEPRLCSNLNTSHRGPSNPEPNSLSKSLCSNLNTRGYSHWLRIGDGDVEGRAGERTGTRTDAGGSGVEGVLFPDDDSRERYRYIGYARELGWSRERFLEEVGREGSPVYAYGPLALNGRHGYDLARIVAADWRSSEERDRVRERPAPSPPRRRPAKRDGFVSLPIDVGRWLTHAYAVVLESDSRRRSELRAALEGFARIAAKKGRRFEASYRYLAVEAGVGSTMHTYNLALELESLGVVKATNRGNARPTKGVQDDPPEATKWALLGEHADPNPFVPDLVPTWTSVALGWRCREVWRVLRSGVTEMKDLQQQLGIAPNTLRPELERLEGRGLARRTGNGRWVRWVGLPMENATGLGADAAAWKEVEGAFKKERATFQKNGYRNLGTKKAEMPAPTLTWVEANKAYEQAAEELVDWSSHLRTVVSYGATEEQEAAREQLAELEQAVDRAKERRDAIVATPRRSTEKVPEQEEEEKVSGNPNRQLSAAAREAGKQRTERMRWQVEISQMSDSELVPLIEESLGECLIDLEIEVDFDLVRSTGQVVNLKTGELLCVLTA